MLPRCFLHGFHGVRHLPDADRASRTGPDAAAPGRRPDLAGPAVVLLAAITLPAVALAGCDGSAWRSPTSAPRPSIAELDPLAESDFDIILLFDSSPLEEFP